MGAKTAVGRNGSVIGMSTSRICVAFAILAAPAAGSEIRSVELTPLVLQLGHPEPVSIAVTTDTSVDRVELELASTLRVRTLVRTGRGLHRLSLGSSAGLLDGYASEDVNRFLLGRLRTYDGGHQTLEYSVFLSVGDASIPRVPVAQHRSGLRYSPRVVNIHMPGTAPADVDVEAVAREFYTFFVDDYEFLNVVVVPSHPASRHHLGVKNETLGIGLSLDDDTADFGSGGRLLGVNVFPIATLFDLAARGSLHETGHAWINFLHSGPLATPWAHWPVSTAARGIMGYSDPASGQGLLFPWDFYEVSPGRYRVEQPGFHPSFNGLELYLMGLAFPTEIPPQLVFDPPQWPCPNCILDDARVVTSDDIIREHGPRVPAYAGGVVTYRMATIVVTTGSHGLSDRAFAYFDHFTARGEATEPLPFSSGYLKGSTLPFWLATSRRGRLSTLLKLPPLP